MMNRLALDELQRFNEFPCSNHATRLVGIPAIHDLLKLHEDGPYPAEHLQLCKWLFSRGREVLSKLSLHKADAAVEQEPEDWRKVSIAQSKSTGH